MTETELDDVVHQLEARGGPAGGGGRPVVLLAHADSVVRAELDRHLTGCGLRVFVAGTATEAMWEALSHASCVDTLLCDPRLPGLAAAELYRRLRVTLPWLRFCLLAPVPVALLAS